jgi:hypothetical protein
VTAGRNRRSAYLDRVNQTAVSAELLGEVVEIHTALPAEARAIQIFELLEWKMVKSRGAALAVAINFQTRSARPAL